MCNNASCRDVLAGAEERRHLRITHLQVLCRRKILSGSSMPSKTKISVSVDDSTSTHSPPVQSSPNVPKDQQ